MKAKSVYRTVIKMYRTRMTFSVMKLEKEKSYRERMKVLASSESLTPGPGGGPKED
jgi:hypothetical protein